MGLMINLGSFWVTGVKLRFSRPNCLQLSVQHNTNMQLIFVLACISLRPLIYVMHGVLGHHRITWGHSTIGHGSCRCLLSSLLVCFVCLFFVCLFVGVLGCLFVCLFVCLFFTTYVFNNQQVRQKVLTIVKVTVLCISTRSKIITSNKQFNSKH